MNQSNYIEEIKKDIIKYETTILKIEQSNQDFINWFALEISWKHPHYLYLQHDMMFGNFYFIKEYYEEFKNSWNSTNIKKIKNLDISSFKNYIREIKNNPRKERQNGQNEFLELLSICGINEKMLNDFLKVSNLATEILPLCYEIENYSKVPEEEKLSMFETFNLVVSEIKKTQLEKIHTGEE